MSKAPKTFLMTETDVSRWPVVFLPLVLVKCVFRFRPEDRSSSGEERCAH